MARFIDLDDVVPAGIDVRLGGETWTLPGDVPVEIYLELDRLWDEAAGDDTEQAVEAARRMSEILLDLFREAHPDMEELPVGTRGLMHLVFRYLNADALGQEDEAPARPQRAGTTKKTSTSRRRTPTKTARRRSGSASST